MTPRDKFILALEGKQPSGRVPHFELVFFLTMEAFGRLHPSHRAFGQWGQMSEAERVLHRRDIAEVYVQIARKYEHSAIFFHGPGGLGQDNDVEARRMLEGIRELSGMDYFLMIHGDATYSLPDGSHMMEFVERLAADPQGMKDRAQRSVDGALAKGREYRRHGALDGFALCSDYCFNNAPFLSPAMFDEFVTPYLKQLTAGYREMGFYVIKHTDGNIMPILDSLVSTNPHALHSLDPQGGVDIAEVKRRVGGRVCLIGNVSCAMLDTGDRPGRDRLGSLRPEARDARRRVHLLDEQLHLYGHGPAAIRTHARRLAEGRQLPRRRDVEPLRIPGNPWKRTAARDRRRARPVCFIQGRYFTATTSLTAGTFSFKCRSTPILSVIAADGQPLHAPLRRTETTPAASSTLTNSMSPPSCWRNSRTRSMTGFT